MSLERRAGVIAPLSAIRGPDDLGAGDTAALPRFFHWMRDSGLSVLQLLPLQDLAPEDSCPYCALSAFALDPLYLSPGKLPETASSMELRTRWSEIASSSAVQDARGARWARIPRARKMKTEFLELLFSSGAIQAEDRDFAAFRQDNSFWLEDYALFRALLDEQSWTPWERWPIPLRERRPREIDLSRERLRRRIDFFSWVQFRLQNQWAVVRREASQAGIKLFGDIPFGVGRLSADAWSRQDEFDFHASMGAPPDQYTPEGQAWGLPAYRWGMMESRGHPWWRERIRSARNAFDLFRIDHAIGFFRTWQVRSGGANGFDIEDPAEQENRGRRFFQTAISEGAPARVVAEDLGVVPEYMPAVLKELGIPGYKIARWEFRPDGSFLSPSEYPPLSVAAAGNHDMPPLAVWWSHASQDERNAYWKMASGEENAPRLSSGARLKLIANLFSAPSELALLQFQDALGKRERVNTPGTVSRRNWRYRVPADLYENPEYQKRSLALAAVSRESGRAP